MKSILYSFYFELIDICDFSLFEMRLISLRDGEVCNYNNASIVPYVLPFNSLQ